ncbi:MAG: hypothetical protein KAS59_06900, partial [Alphaproteobacteria bacterium]|nr:hypothetical protein [Alphaproteobacteria bacterium]
DYYLEGLYQSDSDCREAEGYFSKALSLSGMLLVKLGILVPKQHWWDQPYRTETGAVVYPNKKVSTPKWPQLVKFLEEPAGNSFFLLVKELYVVRTF